MAVTFYFYDLETTGINSRAGRIMQFAGQRTDTQLKSIGEPDNILVKITNDILPEPEAIMITGITPQSTLDEGLTEAEFIEYFNKTICQPETVFVGYNNVRFDDEFMRHAMYRNFYDAYEWCWQDKRGRWDILDVIRMTRALRPDGINWPTASDGKPTNRLELLTAANSLDHTSAHDALSDVNATISLVSLISNKQPKLFEYLLSMRDKKKVAELVCNGQPFLYTSGKYPNIYEKTTVAISLGEHPGKQGVMVYDLRRNPEFLSDMTAEQIAAAWYERVEDETMRFPVKTLQFNRCPAIAPIGVLTNENKSRLKIDLDAVAINRAALDNMQDLRDKLLKALDIMDKQRHTAYKTDESDVDNRLYEGFFSDQDKTGMQVVRAAGKNDIAGLDIKFKDDRLNILLPLYKARNFPTKISAEEREQWEKFIYHKLMDGGVESAINKYFIKLSELLKAPDISANQKYLIEELRLYGESTMPESIEEDQ